MTMSSLKFGNEAMITVDHNSNGRCVEGNAPAAALAELIETACEVGFLREKIYGIDTLSFPCILTGA